MTVETTVECVNPLDLADGDIAAWRLMLANDPELTSPYLTPDWAQAVAHRRSDALVAIFRGADSRPLAFLPVQRANGACAMPAGGPVCDYQALVSHKDWTFDISQAAHALDVGRIDLTAGLKNNAVSEFLQTEDVGHVARFAEGWDAYCADRQAAGSKIISRTRKKFTKFKRDHDDQVEIEAFSRDVSAFDTLIMWKREQMWRTGVYDIFEHGWINQLVRDTFTMTPTASFGGAMFVLRVRGRPAAVLYCLQARAALHAWFVAYDPRYADYSPGQILFIEAIRAAAAAGFTEMDMGPGDYRFKESIANAGRPIGAGFIGRPGLAAAYRAAQFQMRAFVEGLPVGRMRDWPAKAMRRLDIARGLNVSGNDNRPEAA
jgi:CelD/BcsL family acetyltransferase involved in cellulose biosynthesis